MKNSKIKKILFSSLMGILAFAMPFVFTACKKESEINVRIEGEFVQWQEEGSNSWINLITLEEIKELLDDELKGTPGINGINGKQVEFRKTNTHIEWRYVDSNQDEDENWESLIELSELKIKGDNGETPYIGNNGNWWVGDTDTGIKAESVDGKSVEFRVNSEYIQWRYVDSNQGEDDNWINLISLESLKGDKGDKGEDLSVQTYTINYNYNLKYDVSEYFSNYTIEQEVRTDQWVTNMPMPKPEFDIFDGWYIEGTDKKIENYDFVGGNVTLVARYKYEEHKFAHHCKEFKYNEEYNGYDCVITGGRYVVVPAYYDGDNGLLPVVSISGGNAALDEINLPNTLKVIPNTAFMFSEITSINIPASVEKIGINIFEECNSLTKVFVDSKNSKYKSSENNDCIIEKETNTLVVATNGLDIIPENVEHIAPGAFRGWNKNSVIKLPDSLKTLGNYAFAGCTSLERVTVSCYNSKLVSIGDYAFESCIKLSEIQIPQSCTEIGEYSFVSCGSLTNLGFGVMQLTTIGRGAFSGTGITYISFEKITTIPDYLFEGCENLETVNGQNITKIGREAFMNCSKLKYFSFSENLSLIDDDAFKNCTSLEYFQLNENLEIEISAFAGCTSLLRIFIDCSNIANNLTSIDSYGGILSNANTVFIKTGFDVTNSTYLLENFTYQSIDSGYDVYVRNVSE